MAEILDPISAAQLAKPRASAAAPRAIPVAAIREGLAIVLLTALADVTIYRGAGFAGLALLAFAGPLFVAFGSPERRLGASFWIVTAMLVLLAIRLLWLGNSLAAVIAMLLVVAHCLTLHGLRPFVLDVLVGTGQLLVAGGLGLQGYLRGAAGFSPRLSGWFWLNALLPVGVVALFGMLFVMANPDLVSSVVTTAESVLQILSKWLEGMSHNSLEVMFWLAAAYVAIGLLRPLLRRNCIPDAAPSQAREVVTPFCESPLYSPLRNTLYGVIGLFAGYLVFEFATLWFRKFPPGFHYSGYAHEGAAWLTAALALATLVLSLMFRGQVLHDPRLGRLRLLACIWSVLNLLLAVTVYHRMSIYIDFNGMTRMRTIGLFGISTVVVGFALVWWKIAGNRDFIWLIHRQMWALAVAVFLFALTPVDLLVHWYNVRQIMAGDVAPSVQISVHPINAEGLLVLVPLVHCDDPIIRGGVRAMLAERELQAERDAAQRARLGWTARQVSQDVLLERLRARNSDWQEFATDAQRQAAIDRFRKYAYQWY